MCIYIYIYTHTYIWRQAGRLEIQPSQRLSALSEMRLEASDEASSDIILYIYIYIYTHV